MTFKYISLEKSVKMDWVGLYPHPGGKIFPTPQGNLIGQKRDLGPWVNTSEKMSTGKHVQVVFFPSLAYPNISLHKIKCGHPYLKEPHLNGNLK